MNEERLQQEIFAVGQAILDAWPRQQHKQNRPAMLEELVLDDRELRIGLLRLVDIASSCADSFEQSERMAALLSDYAPSLRRCPRRPGGRRVALEELAETAGQVIAHSAQRLILATGQRAAVGKLEELWREGFAATAGPLGEHVLTHQEADAYAHRCRALLQAWGESAAAWPAIPQAERDRFGEIPRVQLSVKTSALTPLLSPTAPHLGIEDAKARLRPLMQLAHRHRAHLTVDMESYDHRDAVLALCLSLLADEEFVDGPSFGLVVQAYLSDAADIVLQLLDSRATVARRQPLAVRLVKGDYWEHERLQAIQRGWDPPVFLDQAATDRNFEQLTRRLLQHGGVRLAVATHNLRAIAHAIAYNRLLGRADQDLEIQLLYGLGDELAQALARCGYRVRLYCPVGHPKEGVAYLLRRLWETTTKTFALNLQRNLPPERLLAAP